MIIPAWNEGVGVIKTIESVLSNGYDNVQVVVVNDGSTDDSDKTIRAFIDDVVKTTPRLAEKITYKYNSTAVRASR